MLAIARDRFLLALQYQQYRTLWTANVFAGAAAWGLIVARGWLTYILNRFVTLALALLVALRCGLPALGDGKVTSGPGRMKPCRRTMTGTRRCRSLS